MHTACKCLNVSIRSRGAELQKVNIDDLQLTPQEYADGFFRESLATVPELEGITKEQPGLVDIRNVGSWVIHRCYNCRMYTHAVHRDYGAALVLINTNIITSPEEIDKLRSSLDYSPVFRIMIDHSSSDELDHLQQPTKFSVSQLPGSVQVALGGLQQQLEQAVHRRATEIEEKIRLYTMEQYQSLEQFRERAHNEHGILTRLICRGDEATGWAANNNNNNNNNNIETPPTTPDGFTNGSPTGSASSSSNVTSGPITTDGAKIPTDSNVKQETNVDISPSTRLNGSVDETDPIHAYSNSVKDSLDTEALFSLEGMEEDAAVTNDQLHTSEDGSSDTDDSSQDEGIRMPRGQRGGGGHPTMARSLPVSVPMSPSFVGRTARDQDGDDDDDDQLSRDPHDPHNIRASIKALAKSVHGDAVFGDLPRPRFSTQI